MGDQRPSMMDRTRSSTLIDPSELQQRPGLPRQESAEGVTRRNSRGKPLLNFDSGEDLLRPSLPSRNLKSSSVFGVDTLWEQEMVKLREVEKREAEEEAARIKKEEEALAAKMAKKKANSKRKAEVDVQEPTNPDPEVVPEPPPTLPAFDLPSRAKPRKAPESESESDDSDRESFTMPRKAPNPTWYAGESDDEKELQTIPNISSSIVRPSNSEDEDDVPLSQQLQRMSTLPRQRESDHDNSDDDERPLAEVMQQFKNGEPVQSSDRPSLSAHNTPPHQEHESDEDNVPLGIRHRKLLGPDHADGNGSDDDDRPLGLKRTQNAPTQNYSTMLLAQQQQQMMLQAQLRNSFAFGGAPSIIGNPLIYSPQFPPALSSPMPMVPMMGPTIQDVTKYGRVDEWRRAIQ
jgi:hypothetical protein